MTAHKGQGYSMAEMSTRYRAQKAPKRRGGKKAVAAAAKAVPKRSCVAKAAAATQYYCSSSNKDAMGDHTAGEGDDFSIRRDDHQIYFAGGLNTSSCSALKHSISDAVAFCGKSAIKSPVINLHVQSTGGSVLATLSVIDFMHSQKIPIDCYVDGFAFSSGALLAVAGHKRFIGPNAVMLLHEMKGNVCQNMKSSDLTRELHNMAVIEKLGANVFLKHSKMTAKQLRTLELADHLLTPAQCLKYGLVDKILS
jgi:ATP-dependent protease ClpP protease subunit